MRTTAGSIRGCSATVFFLGLSRENFLDRLQSDGLDYWRHMPWLQIEDFQALRALKLTALVSNPSSELLLAMRRIHVDVRLATALRATWEWRVILKDHPALWMWWIVYRQPPVTERLPVSSLCPSEFIEGHAFVCLWQVLIPFPALLEFFLRPLRVGFSKIVNSAHRFLALRPSDVRSVLPIVPSAPSPNTHMRPTFYSGSRSLRASSVIMLGNTYTRTPSLRDWISA